MQDTYVSHHGYKDGTYNLQHKVTTVGLLRAKIDPTMQTSDYLSNKKGKQSYQCTENTQVGSKPPVLVH